MTNASYPALRVQSVADGLRRAAEFRQRMEEVVGRIEAMDLEPDARSGSRVEQRLQLLDVARLLDRMNEALIPQPRGTGRFGHALSPSINDARPGEATLRLIASGPRTSRAGPNRAGTARHEACDAGAVLGGRGTSAP